MRLFRPAVVRARRRISFQTEMLEQRTLLSGLSAVTIQAPSAYVSQQAGDLEVTLVRTAVAARSTGAVSVQLSATPGARPTGEPIDDIAMAGFAAVSEAVSFPAGATEATVAVPIGYTAGLMPALVPVDLSVSSGSRRVQGEDATFYLAKDQSAVPPSITAVQRVAGGIAVTFSQPMDPATVTNIHNYAVKFASNQQFSLEDLTGFGLVQTLSNSKAVIGLRRVTYDAATDTVTLVPNEQLGSLGSYTISNAPSLLTKRNRPHKATGVYRGCRASRSRKAIARLASFRSGSARDIRSRRRRLCSRTEADRTSIRAAEVAAQNDICNIVGQSLARRPGHEDFAPGTQGILRYRPCGR